jgi:hypothetical protein
MMMTGHCWARVGVMAKQHCCGYLVELLNTLMYLVWHVTEQEWDSPMVQCLHRLLSDLVQIMN